MVRKGTKVNPDTIHAAGKPRPHVWKVGPDEYKHDMYLPWLRAKAQAKYRKEGWSISFDEYYNLWFVEWPNRGRGSDQMCMTRKDYSKAWTVSNCLIVPRLKHLCAQAAYRKSIGLKKNTGKYTKFINLQFPI